MSLDRYILMYKSLGRARVLMESIWPNKTQSKSLFYYISSHQKLANWFVFVSLLLFVILLSNGLGARPVVFVLGNCTVLPFGLRSKFNIFELEVNGLSVELESTNGFATLELVPNNPETLAPTWPVVEPEPNQFKWPWVLPVAVVCTLPKGICGTGFVFNCNDVKPLNIEEKHYITSYSCLYDIINQTLLTWTNCWCGKSDCINAELALFAKNGLVDAITLAYICNQKSSEWYWIENICVHIY